MQDRGEATLEHYKQSSTRAAGFKTANPDLNESQRGEMQKQSQAQHMLRRNQVETSLPTTGQKQGCPPLSVS